MVGVVVYGDGSPVSSTDETTHTVIIERLQGQLVCICCKLLIISFWHFSVFEDHNTASSEVPSLDRVNLVIPVVTDAPGQLHPSKVSVCEVLC